MASDAASVGPAGDAYATPRHPDGLFKTRKDTWYHVNFLSVAAEFLGTLLFSYYGGMAFASSAAVTNATALVVIVYAFVSVSGSHLNPWVTWATLITGHTALIQGACFIGAQMVGAITGAAITKGLRGPGRDDLGCFSPSDISHAQLWGQETINTFLLIITVFAVAVSQKGSGNVAGLVIGLALFVAASVSGPYTGGALNIARVLGPSVVYGCAWPDFWIYLLAGFTGSTFAAVWAFMTIVVGPYFVFHNFKGFVGRNFVRSTPYSTAADPLIHYDTLSSTDHSLAPYAKVGAGPRMSVSPHTLYKKPPTHNNTPHTYGRSLA